MAAVQLMVTIRHVDNILLYKQQGLPMSGIFEDVHLALDDTPLLLPL